MKQFQQVAVSGAIFNSESQVIMVKRSAQDDFLPGFWEMPGGGSDFGEHPIIALKRELKEEVGLEVEVGKPFYVDDYYMENKDEKIQRIEIFFICSLMSQDQKIVLSHEHSEYKWVGKEANLEMTSYTREVFDRALKFI